MNKAFEKILERLEERKQLHERMISYEHENGTITEEYQARKAVDVLNDAKKIVQEVSEEYKGGWIPCSVRLPDEAFGCLVTVMDCEPSTQTDFENILPYFVGYDSHSWNDADGNEIPFEVIAWQQLPEKYQPKGE